MEIEREKENERDFFGILYTGYLLSIVKIKREIEREREIKISPYKTKTNKKV